MIDNKLNVSMDLGHLLVYDNQPFKKDFINEEDMLERGKLNVQNIFQNLFQLCKTQQGEDEEKRDFDKPKDSVMLPKPITVLPRAKPIPKPKPLTKWEKYRQEKGLAKVKRSRMIYSETAGDWVPRWGKGSAKKIEESTEWAIEEKPGHEGQDPFALRKQEKKLNKMKQMKSEVKNEENRRGKKSVSKNFEENNEKLSTPKMSKKFAKVEKEKNRLKVEKKGLEKTLETVQKSTASIGKFDRKLKNEKEINPIKKKNVDPTMFLSRKQERDRNSRILNNIIGK